MDGEFRVQLKNYDAAKVVGAFIESYGDNLAQAYAKSAYHHSGNVSPDDLCAGYQTNDSLFLVYNREGNFLKVYVEPVNKKDVNHMRELINRYFNGVTKMLDGKKIKWSKPQATITLEECPLTGVYKTKKDALRQIFEDQREKLFLLPIGTILAIGITVYANITDKGDALADAKKAVSSTLESVIVFVVLFFVQFLFGSDKRAFTFKI